ncbi:MAG: hypothetical protein OXG05_07775, partial [Gammaproteobacteria bacterium]|nr:hypothetical protein [Gammaproteobacteria bacterium]
GYPVQVRPENTMRSTLSLTWDQFSETMPESDDFEDRTLLTGSRGVVAGTNYRATLENFEFYGIESVGASTWFRWIAPEVGRFEFDVSDGLNAFVFDGTSTTSLRRVSTMPNQYQDSQFEAAQDREYQIVVLDTAERLVPDYELSWRLVRTPSFGYADNDMMRDAATIEGETGEESVDSFDSATVEPNEDTRTGVGTIWWRWSPPSVGDYVFRLDGSGVGNLAAFEGTSLDDLTFIVDGRLLRFSTREERQYWISLGYRTDSMFADVDGIRLASGFAWGPAPANDVFSSPELLSGTVGEMMADHSFATSSLEEFDHIRGHSSLWWRWIAPSDGWQRFELEDWEAAGLEEESQQGILAIYRERSESSPALLATSDHSYVINGHAEATVRTEGGETYLVRAALRSTHLGDWDRRITFSYAPIETPAWQRYVGRISEVRSSNDDVEDEDLFQTSSISLVGDSGLVAVATGDGLISYSESSSGTLTKEVKVPYRTASGNDVEISSDALLHWDPNLEGLYLLQQDAFFEISEPISSASRLTRCTPATIDGVVPEQAFTDATGESMYVLGKDAIDVYAVRSGCVFELTQTVGSAFKFRPSVPHLRVIELEGTRSIALDSTDGRIYAVGSESLLTFSRTTDGTLALESSFAASEWAEDYSWAFGVASVILADAETLFVVAELSPVVAAFSIGDQDEGENPVLLGVVDGFHLSQESFHSNPFYSHVDWPQRSEGCTTASKHSEERPSIDVFCNGQVFTIGWNESTEALTLSDWFQVGQADRFGHLLRDGIETLSPKKISESAARNRNYVLGTGPIGTLHIFDRATRITENPYIE